MLTHPPAAGGVALEGELSGEDGSFWLNSFKI